MIDYLLWTEKKVQLLFKTTIDFKAKNVHEGVHLESVKDKDAQILSIIASNLPKKVAERVFSSVVNFWQKIELLPKSNWFETKYRNGLDLGKQNGTGRIVATINDIVNESLSGYLATESLKWKK